MKIITSALAVLGDLVGFSFLAIIIIAIFKYDLEAMGIDNGALVVGGMIVLGITVFKHRQRVMIIEGTKIKKSPEVKNMLSSIGGQAKTPDTSEGNGKTKESKSPRHRSGKD